MRANANTPLTDRITTVTSADFDLRILQGQGPIVVEFMSYGCAFCRRLEPVLQEVAEAEGSNVKIFRVNIAVEAELAASFEINGTPTLIMFRDGNMVGRSDGPDPRVEGVELLLSEAFR